MWSSIWACKNKQVKSACTRNSVQNLVRASILLPNMLQRASLMTEGPRLCGNSWVFQQDNAAVHNARLTKDFFTENNITLLDHPTCSPDLNPIENIWGWMTKLHQSLKVSTRKM
uniref:Tc1-like transposase DDE domain-containing protein n=1 Tax=Amphiprion percula TaxID=161767 RepID=A0A3P8S9W1_AMPPE